MQVRYASAIGSQMYTTHLVWSSFRGWCIGLISVEVESRLFAPGWLKKNILCELSTTHYAFVKRTCDLDHTHAGWTSDLDDHMLTLAHVFLLNEDDVSWSSKKRRVLSLSTTKTEYVAYVATIQVATEYVATIQVVWLQSLLNGLEAVSRALELVTLHSDCISSNKLLQKLFKVQGQTKRRDIRYHFPMNRKRCCSYIHQHKIWLQGSLLTIPAFR